MKVVRLSRARAEAVLDYIERHGKRAIVDDCSIELAVFASAGPVAVVSGMTPGVQSFLARLGRADTTAGGPDQPAEREAADQKEGGVGNSNEQSGQGSPVGGPSGTADGSQSGAPPADAGAHNEQRSGDEPASSSAEPGSTPSAPCGVAGCVPGDTAANDAGSSAHDGGPEGTVGHADDPAGTPIGDDTAKPLTPAGESAISSDEVPSGGVADAATDDTSAASGGGFGRFSVRPAPRPGGAFARLRSIARVEPHDLRRAHVALSRLLMDGGESDSGPRWRMSRIATKTAGYLRSWAVSDRHEEVGTPAMLVLSDVSGSMGRICRQITYIALSMRGAVRGEAEIVVATHSNGYAEEVVPASAQRLGEAARTNSAQFYAALVSRHDLRAVVAVGDGDAEELYVALADMLPVPVIWLDPYACNYGPPQVARHPLSARITPAGARRLIHIDHVGTEDLFDALEMGVRIANGG